MARQILCRFFLQNPSISFLNRNGFPQIFSSVYFREFTVSSVQSSGRYDDFQAAERSWVKKFLYGSGPSSEIEELEETVEVEPQYMEIFQEKKKPEFIDRPAVRKKVYKPPDNLEEQILAIANQFCEDVNKSSTQDIPIIDNAIKFQILSKCASSFNHSVPNFQLNKIKTVGDIIEFYKKEVKDTTKFDELSQQELPRNLKIHWDYKDDSKLELYEDYLEYVRKKDPGPPPKYPFRISH